jgi:outer membrane immunogenic protein
MRKYLIASAAVLAAISTASAADLTGPMYPKAPPAPPAPFYIWTGFYGGFNAGATWPNNDSLSMVSSPVTGFGDGIGPGSFAANSALGASGNVPLGTDVGFIGGVQIGYNYQVTNWLFGVEADIQGIANNRHNGTLDTSVGPFAFFGSGETLTTHIDAEARVDWLGTVRGRVGFLATQTFLLYATGGLAYGGVEASTSITQSNNDCVLHPGSCIQTTAATAGSMLETRTGWTVGGGFEWMFAPDWSAKAEYLYYDLGSVTFSNGNLTFGPGSFGGAGGSAFIASQSTVDFTGHIVRAGVNYHF